MVRPALVVCLAGLGLLWACNDHDPHPANSTDPGSSVNPGSGTGSSGLTDGGGYPADSGTNVDAGECTDLDDPTTRVDENAVSDDIPAGIGGDLTTINNTYDLQTAQKHVGSTGQAGLNGVTYREVIRITGGATLERNRIVQTNNGPEQVVNATYSLQASGTSLSLTQRCPTTAGTEAYSFTLQNGQLTLTSALGESFTYVARP